MKDKQLSVPIEMRRMLWDDRPSKMAREATADLISKRDLAEDTAAKDGLIGHPHVTRELILDAFKELRSKGFIARANFLCCSNCATYALFEQAKKRIDEGRAFNGIVYWHGQNDEGWFKNGTMHIGYSSVFIDDKSYGLTDEEIGLVLVAAMVKRGIRCEWNGSGHQKVLVYA